MRLLPNSTKGFGKVRVYEGGVSHAVVAKGGAACCKGWIGLGESGMDGSTYKRTEAGAKAAD